MEKVRPCLNTCKQETMENEERGKLGFRLSLLFIFLSENCGPSWIISRKVKSGERTWVISFPLFSLFSLCFPNSDSFHPIIKFPVWWPFFSLFSKGWDINRGGRVIGSSLSDLYFRLLAPLAYRLHSSANRERALPNPGLQQKKEIFCSSAGELCNWRAKCLRSVDS